MNFYTDWTDCQKKGFWSYEYRNHFEQFTSRGIKANTLEEAKEFGGPEEKRFVK